MPISSETRTTSPFVGNDSITSLPFTFKVFSASDVAVIKTQTSTGDETTLTPTTDYSVTLNANQDVSPGGTVTLVTALATGYTAVVDSDIDCTQPTSLQNGFLPVAVTQALDRQNAIIAQLKARMARALRFSHIKTAANVISNADDGYVAIVDGQPQVVTPSADSSAELALTLAATGGAVEVGADDGSSGSIFTTVAGFITKILSSTGSAIVGFIQSGTGAVASTVQAKLRQVVSISDYDTPSNALTAGAGKSVFGSVSTVVTTPVVVPSNTELVGGWITSGTTNHHIVSAIADGSKVTNVELTGVKGTTVLNNSAVRVAGNDVMVDNITAQGMSGMAVYVSGSSGARISNSNIRGLTPDSTYVNGSDVSLYQDNSYASVTYNLLEGGADTECGVLVQINSIKNLVHGNKIKAHRSYGVVDYEVSAKATHNIITGNHIEDIDGSLFGGAKGAGIYAVSTGGQIISNNSVRNTNIGTTLETLAPAGIGLNNLFSSASVSGNVISDANWYGLMLVSNIGCAVNFANNVITEADKGSVYIKASSHANIHGGVYEQLTTTPLAVRGVSVNVAGGGTFTGVSVHGNRIRGSFRGIETGSTNQSLFNNNNVSEVNGIGIRLTTGSGLACVGNVVDVIGASSPALDVSGITHSTISGNVFKGTHTTLINFSGTCTGTRFDKSNILVGMTVNNINNAASGCIVEVYGTAAPTALNHQPGDRVINSAPAVGQPKSWVCTVAGVPGTWVSEGNL